MLKLTNTLLYCYYNRSVDRRSFRTKYNRFKFQDQVQSIQVLDQVHSIHVSDQVHSIGVFPYTFDYKLTNTTTDTMKTFFLKGNASESFLDTCMVMYGDVW